MNTVLVQNMSGVNEYARAQRQATPQAPQVQKDDPAQHPESHEFKTAILLVGK